MKDQTKMDDSGVRDEFDSGAVRDGSIGKGRYDLLSPLAMHRLAVWMEAGGLKYEDRNWEKGMPCSEFADSAMRHLMKIMCGMTDEDHLAALLFNAQGLAHTKTLVDMGLLPSKLDDLPSYFEDTDEEAADFFAPKKWVQEMAEEMDEEDPEEEYDPLEDLFSMWSDNPEVEDTLTAQFLAKVWSSFDEVTEHFISTEELIYALNKGHDRNIQTLDDLPPFWSEQAVPVECFIKHERELPFDQRRELSRQTTKDVVQHGAIVEGFSPNSDIASVYKTDGQGELWISQSFNATTGYEWRKCSYTTIDELFEYSSIEYAKIAGVVSGFGDEDPTESNKSNESNLSPDDELPDIYRICQCVRDDPDQMQAHECQCDVLSFLDNTVADAGCEDCQGTGRIPVTSDETIGAMEAQLAIEAGAVVSDAITHDVFKWADGPGLMWKSPEWTRWADCSEHQTLLGRDRDDDHIYIVDTHPPVQSHDS